MESRRPAEAINGSTAAFGVRLVGELPRLRRHLAARMGHPGRVDDAVQETVLRALEGAHRFERERALWPWLRTIADRASGSTGRRGFEEALTVEPVVTDEPPAESQDLTTVLARLPDPERVVVERFYVGGESVREISTALGIAKGTVQSRMWRARRRLALLAAALAPAIWLVVRKAPGPAAPNLDPSLRGPLTLETTRLPRPSLRTVEHGADAPFTWSLEGGTWVDDDPANTED